ncbi:abhydrolase domain-containing protein 2 [Maniola hyperantus]|uniref:abhydrolase domain-containing protein 2 n=1 Tax=Aphantopus hyperantus TaxID=2795564 RepID=UPI00156A285B|nr:abhydrolase domain-containing protein 2 [Maniola hyperantus]
MSTVLLAVVAVILCVLFRILNVNSQPHKPVIYGRDRNFIENILFIAPFLNEPYIPTRLWGFSGHVQTILHSLIGRVRCPWPIGGRISLILPDKSTLTYDLYEPLGSEHEDDVTVAICPGIGNTSESVYIRTYVHYSQRHGYRCAVLNHIGALNSVPVTSNRIFSYGHTDDFSYMVENLMERYPNTKLILVGFSLGGNLITKYLGEERKRPKNIIGGISICQGYNAIDTMVYLLQWQNFRRFYLYIMTDNYRNIITRHKRMLLNPEMKNTYSLDEKMIVSAGTLPDLDEAYSRRVHGFESVAELYKWSSSAFYLKNIKTPMIFINARDDPIVPEPLLPTIREFVSLHDNVMFLELSHGGHLGFYEGGLVYANPVTWLDRALAALVGGLLMAHHKCAPKPALTDTTSDLGLPDDEPDLIKSATIIYRDPLDKVPQKA